MSRKAKFLTPENTLKKKVGDGGIPAEILKKSQELIEKNAIDYTPDARQLLNQITAIKSKITASDKKDEQTVTVLLNLVMQLKSNGSMFRLQLISMVSDVMLKFLEKIEKTDSDFIEILTVYTKIIDIILKKNLTGNGGPEGYALTQELSNACARYYAKHGIET